MRLIAAFLTSVLLAGCGHNPEAKKASDLPSIYIAAVQNKREQCYFRVVDDYPLDSICVQGDILRYSEPAIASATPLQPIPATVTALFRSITVESILERRAPPAEPNPALPATAPPAIEPVAIEPVAMSYAAPGS